MPHEMRGIKPVVRTLTAPGQHITQQQANKMLDMLRSGKFPVKAEIARACMCSVQTIDRFLERHPEIKEGWDQAIQEQVGMVERSMFDLAINGSFEPAKEKAQEFILTHHKPEVYSEAAQLAGTSGATRKRVVMFTRLEEVAVDDNGIPIAQSKSPLQPETIDVK